MSAVINPKPPVARKKRNADALLADKVGMVIKGKDCVVVVLKSENIIELVRMPEKGIDLSIWAVCGTTADKRKFENMFRQFESELKYYLSERDLNVKMVHDLVSSYLDARFLTRQYEKANALEFILAEITASTMTFYVIYCDGNSCSLNDIAGTDLTIIGCGGDEKREKLRTRLKKKDFSRMRVKKIIQTVRLLLRKKYRGRFLATGFSTLKDRSCRKKSGKKRTSKKKN